MKDEELVMVAKCATCGAATVSTAVCDDCHFAYCDGHSDGEAHACEDVCADCEDDFEDHFWGAPLFG